jgi:hypothetical protein
MLLIGSRLDSAAQIWYPCPEVGTAQKGLTDMPLNALDTAQGRMYTWRDGAQYVSVTTAIGDGVPKPGLARWMAKEVARIAARERKELATIPNALDVVDRLMDSLGKSRSTAAAELGSKVHATAEAIAKGDATLPVLTEEELPYVERFRDFVAEWSPSYVEAEASVFSRTYGYAGTLDAIVEVDGKRCVVDYKTGKSVWPEVALQLAAYANADFIGRQDGSESPIPKCRHGYVLHLRPEKYELIPVDISGPVFDTFLSALDMHRWLRNDSKLVLGTPRGEVMGDKKEEAMGDKSKQTGKQHKHTYELPPGYNPVSRALWCRKCNKIVGYRP